MSKSKVVVLRTSPNTVVNDYSKLLELSNINKKLDKNVNTILKLNLSWTQFFPACSTQPWQLDGTLKALREQKYKKLIAVENQTVVTHPWKGAYYNKWLPILDKYKVKYSPLTNVEWVEYKPKAEMLQMNNLFGKVIVPKMFLKSNVIHFPTMKTHGHTITTGAMKNAFGGLIPKYRHHAHKKIHEVLVDLLAIQKEIHKGIFAVMDGGICGNGAGPRTMIPFEGNVILGSDDQVAIDAVAAKIMGFDPLNIKYIKLAHDRGLGTGDFDQIDIVGLSKNEVSKMNFKFKTSKSLVIFGDQLIRKGPLRFLEKPLLHSPLMAWAPIASNLYHDFLWYPTIGKARINSFMKTGWGELFSKYSYGKFPKHKEIKQWNSY